jgi:TonB-dependent starch-binding outer membrane protein SusC
MRNLLLIATCVLFAAGVSFGQQRVVTGTVTESDTGTPVPGANVIVKGTTVGTVTDMDGKYSLNLPEDATALVYSFVGFVSEEVVIGTQSVIDVALSSDITALSEIVVTGYGTQEKKEITSAVASVKSESFQIGNVQDPTQLIQGKVAGLSIARVGSNPNDGFTVRLRGLATLSSTNAGPLVVVDGVIGADLRNIDPNDIASMDVLKDASAAAIYGTRGSSGVIIVTTKTGSKGKMAVDFNGYVNMETPYRFPDMLTADEWRDFSDELGLGTDYGASTDWFDEITQTGVSQVYNLAVSGADDKTNYRISLNYRDIQGTGITTGFERFNTRINLTHKTLNDRLTLGFNVGGTLNSAKYGSNQAFKMASIYNPTAPVRADDNTQWPTGVSFPDGNFNKWDGYFQEVLFDYLNPVALMEQQTNEGIDKNLNIQLRAGYEIIDNLIFDVAYSFLSGSEIRNRYSSKYSFGTGTNRNGLAYKGYSDSYNQLLESTLRWNGDIGNGTLDLVGGYSYQDFAYEGFNVEAGDFITDAFEYNRLQSANDIKTGIASVNSYKNTNRIIAFFGRANFSWDQTWFVSASLRQEGSSRFGEDNKWGLFPGVSAGVELANFINSSSVTNLKFRVSYGETGNNVRDSYLSKVIAVPSGSSFYYNGEFVPSYGPNRNDNPILGWESKKETNIGFDYSFFGDKLFGAVDYYTRKTESLLWEFGVPQPPNLAPRTWTNVGDLRNSGLELLINWKAVSKPDFTYTATIAYSHYLQNDIVSLSDPENGFNFGIEYDGFMGSPGQNDTPLVRIAEGEPMGQLWGLVFTGIAEDGQYTFEDIAGGGTNADEPDGKIEAIDRQVIGNGLPDFDFGWGNTFTWKNFDANVFFRGVIGHDIVNSMRGFYEVPGAITSYNLLKSARDLKNPDTGVYPSGALGKVSSFHVENGDYFRLENLSIGYNFRMNPGSVFTRARLYLAGNNLFVITNYQGPDPEVRYTDTEDSNNILAPGIDRRETWYLTRSVSLGINLGF